MLDNVIELINNSLPEIKIKKRQKNENITYSFGNRRLILHFFSLDEFYEHPDLSVHKNILLKHNIKHGGFIEIKEGQADRQGWNIVLFRDTESIYGDWNIVETYATAFNNTRFEFQPFATEVDLLGKNLSNYFGSVTDVYKINIKVLEQDDLVKIVEVFIP